MIRLSSTVFDEGLASIAGNPIDLVICQGEPMSNDDATKDMLSGGKRVSVRHSIPPFDVALENGQSQGSRRIRIISQNISGAITHPVSGTEADLWIALVSGNTLLAGIDSVSNNAVAVGDTISIPEIIIELSNLQEAV